MPLGPGALSVLLQPTHVQNAASGTGVFRAADLQQRKQQDEWYRAQREREMAEQQRQFNVGHDFEVGKFAYGAQDKRRLEEMGVYDELLEADGSQDPQKMLAAWNKARARGLNAPGYEEKINQLFKSKGQEGEAAQPEASTTSQPTETAKPRESIKGPIVGESIGDGWEVVDTPPEAKAEAPAPAQWLTNEMESRGEIPVQPGPGMERSPFTGQMAPPAPQESLAPPQGLAGGLPAPQPQGPPPGSTVVYGSDGRPLGTVDPETAMARSRSRVQEALSPLVQNARTAEEKRAAAIAMDTGQRLVGTMPVDKIVVNAQERYDSELGRDTAKTVARGGREAGAGGSGMGTFAGDTGLESLDFRAQTEARMIAEGIKRAYNTKALNEAVSANAAMVANAEANTGVQNLAAVKHMLQITEQGRLSNQDLEMALAAGGKLNALHAQLMAWTEQGRLPPGYLSAVKAYGQTLQAIELEKRAEIFEEARGAIMTNSLFARMSPEDQENMANWVAGYASNTSRYLRPIGGKGKPKKSKGGKAAAGDDEAADAIMGGD